MFVVTNRQLSSKAKGLKVFGSTPNHLGPNELRLVEVARSGSGYSASLLGDELTPAAKKSLKDEFDLDIDVQQPHYASLRVACELMKRARDQKKHILFYVHGYNNDVADILKAAMDLEETYDVLVVPFSWPANGGGAVTGSAAYLSDKKDARASADALNSFISKIHFYHGLLSDSRSRALWQRAIKKHPDNPEASRHLYAELMDKECKVTLNLLCHSMGNYVFKHALKSGSTPARQLVFDNVCLVAADANNEAHPEWIERVQFRNRLYVVINENDFALKWSRRKPGDEQLARLGHYLRNLVARNTFYLDVTRARHVGTEHGYFTGSTAEKNAELRTMFGRLFTGGVAEVALKYHADLNAYRLE